MGGGGWQERWLVGGLFKATWPPSVQVEQNHHHPQRGRKGDTILDIGTPGSVGRKTGA